MNGVQGVEGSNPFIPTRDLKGIHGNMNSLFSFLTAVFPLSIGKKPDSPACKYKKSVFFTSSGIICAKNSYLTVVVKKKKEYAENKPVFFGKTKEGHHV